MFLKSDTSWKKSFVTLFLACSLGGLLLAASAWANAVETSGEPGSPGATTTIDGKQLPPPPDKHFGGKIERNVIDSTTLLAAAPGAAEGCAQHPADHDR